MEEEEQDIIEVDKSLLAGNFNRDKSVKTLDYYCCAQSLSEGDKAKVWEHGGKSYIVTGCLYHGEKDIVPYVYEVVPLIPDMPHITYEQSHTVASWLDGWVDDIGDELAQKVIDIEEYFSRSLDRGSHLGQLVRCKNRMYVCNGKQVTVVAKKHGNQIQESFAWANPEQEVLSI
jgi:hypothetical protein